MNEFILHGLLSRCRFIVASLSVWLAQQSYGKRVIEQRFQPVVGVYDAVRRPVLTIQTLSRDLFCDRLVRVRHSAGA